MHRGRTISFSIFQLYVPVVIRERYPAYYEALSLPSLRQVAVQATPWPSGVLASCILVAALHANGWKDPGQLLGGFVEHAGHDVLIPTGHFQRAVAEHFHDDAIGDAAGGEVGAGGVA